MNNLSIFLSAYPLSQLCFHLFIHFYGNTTFICIIAYIVYTFAYDHKRMCGLYRFQRTHCRANMFAKKEQKR